MTLHSVALLIRLRAICFPLSQWRPAVSLVPKCSSTLLRISPEATPHSCHNQLLYDSGSAPKGAFSESKQFEVEYLRSNRNQKTERASTCAIVTNCSSRRCIYGCLGWSCPSVNGVLGNTLLAHVSVIRSSVRVIARGRKGEEPSSLRKWLM